MSIMSSASLGESSHSKQDSKAIVESLNQTRKEYNEVKMRYDKLLKLAEQQNESSSSSCNPDGKSGQISQGQDSIELQQWNSMWTRLITMITRYVPYPSAPSRSDSEKRAILIDLVSKLCDQVTNQNEFEILKKKYSKAKKNLHILNSKYSELVQTVHVNSKILNERINKVNTAESDKFAQKLDELGDIIAQQLKQEEQLINESYTRKSHLKAALSKLKSKKVGSSSSDESNDEEINQKYQKQKSKKISRSQLFENDSSEDEVVAPRKKSQKRYHLILESESNSDSEEEFDIKPKKAQRSMKKVEEEGSESESDDFAQSRSKMKSKLKSASRKSHVIESSDSDSQQEEESEPDYEETRSRKKSRKYETEEAERIVDEMAGKSKSRSSKSKTANYSDFRYRVGNHVNDLIEVTNKLGENYKHLKHQISSSDSDDIPSPSISKISYIQDSVVKTHGRHH